ncbi:hypothetical protein [Rahnella contaminans]|uniref:hypothetical protein n=1 Tax=Rahnella contaminans TaxID=2703882 RepID=UPI0023DC9426|nr:hypothetical protein [Rahnella contaminans]MDF1897161.1 hypothetical protein [Rahnella contaminans]
MTDSNKPIAEAQTKAQGTGTDAQIKSKDKGVIYFELSTGYYYVVDGETATTIEDENNRLQGLVEKQINAAKAFSDIQGQCLAAPKDPVLSSKYSQLEQTLFDANKNLKSGLNFLEPMQTADDTEDKLHSLSEIDKNTEKLIEVLPIRKSGGKGKVIYVRPSLNSKRWEPYLPEQAESGKASFIKNGKIDKEELHKQLKDVSVKIKKDWDIVDPADHTGSLFAWSDKWNKAAKFQLHDDKDQSGSDHFDASAGAQLLRYTAGVGASLEFDPVNMEAQAKVSGSAEFAIWEGKANFKVMFPHRLGWLPSVPKRGGGECVLGYFRLDLEVVATSSVGASLTAELGITINKKPDGDETAGIRGSGSDYQPTPPPGERKISLTKVTEKSEVKGGIRAFAGVEAKGEVSGSVMWKEPEKMTSTKEDDYKAIAKISESTSYLNGAGFEATFEIKYAQGKIYIACHAGLCWGVGASGGIDFEVDGGHLFDFLKYVYYLLRDADYQKLAIIIAEDAFDYLLKLNLLTMVGDSEAVRAVYGSAQKLDIALTKYFKQKRNRLDFIDKISANNELCRFSTPEVKGNMLAMLTEEDFVDALTDIWEGNRLSLKQGVMNILRWVQSKSEYENVLQHCSLNLGEKKYSDWKIKHKQLAIRMYFGDTSTIDLGKVTMISDGFGETFEALYPSLSDLPMAGFPFVPNDSIDYTLVKDSINRDYYPNQALV